MLSAELWLVGQGPEHATALQGNPKILASDSNNALLRPARELSRPRSPPRSVTAPPRSAGEHRYHLVYRYADSRLAAQHFEQD